MANPTIHMITERLERLERENRRLKQGGAISLVVVALLATGGAKLADGPKVVEAERFVVRDSDGKAWASLSSGGMALMDGEGRIRALVAVFKDGSSTLALSDDAGNPRSTLSAHANGEPSLDFSDKAGNSRVNLTVKSDGNSSLSFSDRLNQQRIALTVQPSMSALFLRGVDGRPRIAMGTSSLNDGRIIFTTSDGAVRMGLGMNRDGVPSLTLSDAAKHGRFVLSTENGAPSLKILDEQERARMMLTPAADGTPHLQLLDQREVVRFEAPSIPPDPGKDR